MPAYDKLLEALEPDMMGLMKKDPAKLEQLAHAILQASTLKGDLTQAFALCGEESFGAWLPRVSPHMCWRWKWTGLVTHVLDLVTVGLIDRLIFSMPPRHGKSECVTIRYPVYRMQKEPNFRAIIAGHSAELVNEFSNSARSVARGVTALAAGRGKIKLWGLENGSTYQAASIRSGIVGYGGNLYIIDDPIRSRHEAESASFRTATLTGFRNELYTRLEPGAAMVIIMTRWNEDDLAGHLLQDETGDKWLEINLAALALPNDPLGREVGEALCPERYDEKALKRILNVIKERAFNSQFQGRPTKSGGNVFMTKWWAGDSTRYAASDIPIIRRQSVGRWMSFDTAYSEEGNASYSALVVGDMLSDYRLRITDVQRGHFAFPELVKWVTRCIQDHNADGKLKQISIEQKASGMSLTQVLEQKLAPELVGLIDPVQPKGSKEERANAASYWCENGSIVLPWPGMAVPWLPPFTDELFAFPAAPRDDQVDAFTQIIDRTIYWLQAGIDARIATGGN